MTVCAMVLPPTGPRNADAWPAFLDLLDSDPEKAFRQFYCFVMAAFGRRPPAPLRDLSPEDRQDLLHDGVLHCVRNDFRVLRQYVPKGRSFAAWLYMVFTNKCRDHLRTADMRVPKISIHANEEGRSVESRLADPSDLPDSNMERTEVLSVVRGALETIGERCRLLLEMAADGLKPREMVKLLGLAGAQNKKVADDLRYCRDKLKRKLREMGFDIGQSGS